jgi:hypothetical protein
MTANLEAQWIVGFVDGEGCFHLDVHMNQTCSWKIQVQPEFIVVQNKVDEQVLYALKKYFKCGSVSINRQDRTGIRMMYRVKNVNDLNDKILPFFEKHQLKTKKNVEFKRFREIVHKMKANYHTQSLEQFLEVMKLGEDLRVRSEPSKGYRSKQLVAQIAILKDQCKQN